MNIVFASLSVLLLSGACSQLYSEKETVVKGQNVEVEKAMTLTQSAIIKKNNITLHYVTFDSRLYDIEVADQPNGPGSLWKDAKSAAKAHGALVAINAGFFTPEGKPLGLCIDDGLKSGFFNQSSLGAGALQVTKQGEAEIIRRSKINTKNAQHLLQAGPFLREKGRSISHLSEKEARPRSFIAWDGKNGWMLGYVEKITLKDLGHYLKSLDIPGFKIETVLNLDGGRSSQLYVSKHMGGREKQVQPFMNRKVRNFILVKKNASPAQ